MAHHCGFAPFLPRVFFRLSDWGLCCDRGLNSVYKYALMNHDHGDDSSAPERGEAADDVDPGNASYPPLLPRHEENLLPLLLHGRGIHRDLLEFIRLDVRV